MKRYGSIILILVASMALMTGCTSCSDDEKKNSKNPVDQYKQYSKYLPILGAILDHSIPEPPPPYVGPAGVIATDGDYTDKVVVSWSATAERAVSYKVYRSDSGEGTYNLIGTVDAANINAAASIMSKSITAMSTSTPPSVSIPTPANGATNVVIGTLVTADFNENINCST